MAGTAKVPPGVIIAPGTDGPSTGTIKLLGIPVLFLFLSVLYLNLKDNFLSNVQAYDTCNNDNLQVLPHSGSSYVILNN